MNKQFEDDFEKRADELIKKWLIRCISRKNHLSRKDRKNLFQMTIEQLEILERDGVHER